MSMRRQSGFSTLEVIAAVAIIGIALIPIAALQTQLARGQARLAEAQADSTAVQNAMSLLRDINPMLTPTGERDLGSGVTLHWTSTAVSQVRPSVNPPGFEVQLYRVRGDIVGQTGAATALQIDLVGWRGSNAAPDAAPATE